MKLKDTNIEVLKFKDELIKLCEKYNCDISSTQFDDGSINISLGYKNYIMNDDDTKKIYYFDINEKIQYPIDEIIKGIFDCDSHNLGGLNNIKVQCGIFTNDSSKAENKLIEIKNKFNDDEIERLILSEQNKELRLKNGNRYVWIKLIESSKGYRCRKAIIDRGVSLEQLDEIVFPICQYCGRDDIEII